MFPSSATVMQQLAAGSLDIEDSGLVDALRAIDQRAPASLLRIANVSSGYEMYAKPTIKSIAELKGKIIMHGGDVTATATAARFFEPSVAVTGPSSARSLASPRQTDDRETGRHAATMVLLFFTPCQYETVRAG